MFPGLVLDRAQLHAAVNRIAAHGEFVLDVETVGERRLHPLVNDVRWVSLATHGFACAIPMGHPNGDRIIAPAARRKDPGTNKFVTSPAIFEPPPPQLPREEVFEALWPLLASDRRKVGSNILIDMSSIAKYLPAPPSPPFADTIGGCTVLNENIKRKGLKDLTERLFGVKYDRHNTGRMVEKWGLSVVGVYSYLDAVYSWLLWLNEKRAIKNQGLQHVMDFECELLEELLPMKLRGAPVDDCALEELDLELTAKLVLLENEIYSAVGREFNINSGQQMAEVLFAPVSEGGQGLKPVKLTDGAMERGVVL